MPATGRSFPVPDSRIILLDQDGVIADFEAALAAEMYRISGGRFWVPVGDRSAPRASVDYEARFGREAAEMCKAVMQTPGFYADLPPMPGALDAISELSTRGWYVAVCTAPLTGSRTCAAEKLSWLTEHLGPEAARRAIITKDKTLPRGRFLVDDRPQAGLLSPTWQQVLFASPTNGSVPVSLPIVARAETWEAVLELVGSPS